MNKIGAAPDNASTPNAANRLKIGLKIILVAAIVTAPLYVIGETFDLSHLWKVAMINGGTALAAVMLLSLVQRGHVRLVSELAVWGLLVLIAWLAATNGEPIHVNVVNFVLVLVLANLLLGGRGVVFVAIACAVAMTGVAYHQSAMTKGLEGNEVFVETIVQFLPQFILIAVLLKWRPEISVRRPLSKNASASPHLSTNQGKSDLPRRGCFSDDGRG